MENLTNYIKDVEETDVEILSESDQAIIDYIFETNAGKDVDEGLVAGLLSTIGGVAFGPRVGQAICAALGIQRGALYDLLTSRLVTTAICAKLGLRA